MDVRPWVYSWVLGLALIGNVVWGLSSLYGRWTYERRVTAQARGVLAFADTLREDLRSKQCVYLSFVPRDTIRRRLP